MTAARGGWSVRSSEQAAPKGRGLIARMKQALGGSAAPPPPPSASVPRAPVPAQAPAPKPAPAKAEAPRERAVERAVEKDAKADVGRGYAKESKAAPEMAKKKAPSPARVRREQEEPRSAPRDEGFDGFAERDEPVPMSLEEADGAAASTGAFARVGLADEADEDREEGGIGSMPTPAPLPSLGTLRGRVVLHRDGTLVLEVDASFAFAWRPPASLLAITADGESALVTLRIAGTTAAAELQPGMRLRLVIELPDGMPMPERLELEVEGRRLTIAPLGHAMR